MRLGYILTFSLLLTAFSYADGPADTCDIYEEWDTIFGYMSFYNDVGNDYYGYYARGDGWFEGKLEGHELNADWYEGPSFVGPYGAGKLKIIFSEECDSFSGNWKYIGSEGWDGPLNGTRGTLEEHLEGGCKGDAAVELPDTGPPTDFDIGDEIIIVGENGSGNEIDDSKGDEIIEGIDWVENENENLIGNEDYSVTLGWKNRGLSKECTWRGEWIATPFGRVYLTQEGEEVEGVFEDSEEKLNGIIFEDNLIGTTRSMSGDDNMLANILWKMSDGCEEFSGNYSITVLDDFSGEIETVENCSGYRLNYSSSLPSWEGGDGEKIVFYSKEQKKMGLLEFLGTCPLFFAMMIFAFSGIFVNKR